MAARSRTSLANLILLCVLARFVSSNSKDDAPMYPVREVSTTVRIFDQAPRGTVIYQIPREDILNISTLSAVVKPELSGPDSIQFRLSEGILSVDQWPRLARKVGTNYRVTILFRSQQSSQVVASIKLTILVSKRNQHAPVFAEEPYHADVFRYAKVGTHILRMNVTDDDEEHYNRDIRFSLPETLKDHVHIIESNGTMTVGPALRESDGPINFTLIASDGGSPQHATAVNISIFLRDTSEPVNLTVHILNLTSVNLCWTKPRYGRVKRYEILYNPTSKPSQKHRLMLKKAADSRQCHPVSGLESFEEYAIEVRAWGGNQPGASSKLLFLMDINMCDSDPCGNGKCISIPRDPGYRCICPDGSIATSCVAREETCQDEDCSQPPSDQHNNLCNCRRRKNRKQCEEDCLRNLIDCENGGTAAFHRGQVTCDCPKGFYGPTCHFHDPCSSAMCQHGGSCRNTSATKFYCECVDGYFGEFCEHFNPCWIRPCLNNGQCQNITDTKYHCYCVEGFYGINCSKRDPCQSAPCQNNGMCHNLTDIEYRCECQQGFHGKDCQLYNPCLDNQCLHGGMCNSIDGHSVCTCTTGRFGKRCEHVNLCEQIEPCGDHTVTCHNTSDTAYRCVCQPGWSGKNCTNFNPCATLPCQNDGQCVVISNAEYVCQCPLGFYGNNCEHIDYCASEPCQHGSRCQNGTNGGYSCVCKLGYYGYNCENFNPCVNAACANGATCKNTSTTTYECLCKIHFFGELCQNFNSCHADPCQHGECVIRPNNNYRCECPLGYFGTECQFHDPCEKGPCENDATCVSVSDEMYTCECKKNYYGENCQYFRACESNPCLAGLCSELPDGGFHCECPKGVFGPRCESTDPCTGEPCKNGGSCITETPASYSCSCESGFYGKLCEKFNPCIDQPCGNGATCKPQQHDTYFCTCPPDLQGKNCDQRVPCNFNGKLCYNDGHCIRDLNGTYSCSCPVGYQGYRCHDYNPCSARNVCHNGGSCTNLQRGLYECTCQPGFFGKHCEYHRPCNVYKCQHNGTCVHTMDGDVCHCTVGFEEICRRERSFDPRGSILWPSTEYGKMVSEECPRTKGKFATRKCHPAIGVHAAHWGEPDISECGVGVYNREQASEALLPYHQGNITLTSVTVVMDTMTLLESAVRFAYTDKNLTDDVVTIVDNIIGLPRDLLMKSNVSSRVLRLLERLTINMQWAKDNATLIRENVQIQVKAITWKEHDIGTIYVPENIYNVHIHIPEEVFQRQVSSEHVRFMYFNDGRLFQGHGQAEVIGGVISAKVGLEPLKDLKTCIKYTLPNRKVSQHNRCVFWQKKDNTWSPEGIETVSYRGPRTTCCSSHLTYFSVAADPEVSAASSVNEEWFIFIASHAGIGCAIICLGYIVVTYMTFHNCTLSHDNLYIFCTTWVLPSSILLLIFLVLLALSVKEICVQATSEEQRKSASFRPCQVIASLLLLIEVGIQWTCSYLSTVSTFLEHAVFLHYIIFSLSGGIGITAIIAFIMSKPETKKTWSCLCRNGRNDQIVEETERDYTLVPGRGRQGDLSDQECVLDSHQNPHSHQRATDSQHSHHRSHKDGKHKMKMTAPEINTPHRRPLAQPCTTTKPAKPRHRQGERYDYRSRCRDDPATPLNQRDTDALMHTKI